ncbi:hypothetical protein CAPTEDRAFT_125771, partial [Capitella teleta]
FAYSRNYAELFATRIIQGFASAVAAVTGMSLLASTFTVGQERNRAMSVASGVLSVGLIGGPVYGSLLYEFVGHSFPFLFLTACVLFLFSVLQLMTMQEETCIPTANPVSAFLGLFCDPLIYVALGNVFLYNLHVSVVVVFLPLRLLDVQNAPTWQLGVIVLPAAIGYMVASAVSPRIPCISKYALILRRSKQFIHGARFVVGCDVSLGSYSACLCLLWSVQLLKH